MCQFPTGQVYSTTMVVLNLVRYGLPWTWSWILARLQKKSTEADWNFNFFLIFCFANMRAVRPHGDTIYTKYTPRTSHIRILPKFPGIFQSLKVFKKFKKNQKSF